VVVAVTGRGVVPTRYDIYVSPEDMARIGNARSFVESDLSAFIHSEAMQRGWHVMTDGVQVRLHRELTGTIGVPRVVASFADAGGLSEPSPLTQLETAPLVTEIETRPAVTEPDHSHQQALGRPSWRLVPVQDTDPELVLPERLGAVTIGRSPGCDLHLAYPTVSGVHARVRRTTSGLLVEDAHSRNGTYVEEERIVDPVELAEGMVVGFSRSGPRYKRSQGRLQQSGQERGSPW
jgi:hypothetical protein